VRCGRDDKLRERGPGRRGDELQGFGVDPDVIAGVRGRQAKDVLLRERFRVIVVSRARRGKRRRMEKDGDRIVFAQKAFGDDGRRGRLRQSRNR